jgi:predicted glycoside hydrolase/deacetylase ChbG (UPF0249 family)
MVSFVLKSNDHFIPMKKPWSLLLLTLFAALHLQAQVVRLVVRADDLGSSHSANEAIIKSYKGGIVTSVEVMTPTPWFPEAIKFLEQNPGLDVGVHLTLTSEWENIKWRPLTSYNSLTDEN